MTSPDPFLRQPFKPLAARRLTFGDDYLFGNEGRRDDIVSGTNYHPPVENGMMVSARASPSPWVKKPL